MNKSQKQLIYEAVANGKLLSKSKSLDLAKSIDKQGGLKISFQVPSGKVQIRVINGRMAKMLTLTKVALNIKQLTENYKDLSKYNHVLVDLITLQNNMPYNNADEKKLRQFRMGVKTVKSAMNFSKEDRQAMNPNCQADVEEVKAMLPHLNIFKLDNVYGVWGKKVFSLVSDETSKED